MPTLWPIILPLPTSETTLKPFLSKLVTVLFCTPLFTGASLAEVSLHAHAATSGIGAELGYKPNSQFGLRLGWQQLDVDFEYQAEDGNGIQGDELNYDGNLNLKNASLFADWYPFKSSFHLTGGLLHNTSAANFSTNCGTNGGSDLPSTQSCEVGDGTVSSSIIDEVQVRIDFDEALAPYLGIGWNYVSKHNWSINSDFGLALLGKANADIQATGICNNTGLCRVLLDMEERELEKDLEDLDIFPILKIGFGFVF